LLTLLPIVIRAFAFDFGRPEFDSQLGDIKTFKYYLLILLLFDI